MATPDQFWGSCRSAETEDGSISRHIIFPIENRIDGNLKNRKLCIVSMTKIVACTNQNDVERFIAQANEKGRVWSELQRRFKCIRTIYKNLVVNVHIAENNYPYKIWLDMIHSGQ